MTSFLVEETARRSTGPANIVQTAPLTALRDGDEAVVLAERSQVDSLLPAELGAEWSAAVAALHPTGHPEGYTIVSLVWHGSHFLVIAGNDQRGELFGAGWLIRHTNFATGALPRDVHVFEAPDKPVRGHQIGYRAKNNTYDAWTLAQFEQHIRDLAIFGNNTIQLISPNSDDAASSPLFHAPAFETVVGISAILDKYGLSCDLYYPEMRADYTKPDAVEAELKDFETLVKAMPRIDSLHIPGGDPGHTAPEVLFPLVEREAEVLHRYHPGATVWVSAQGFTQERYERFYELLAQHPRWLNGVFFGPQSRDSMETQRAKIPAEYPLEFYPDIAHTMHSQFPVPEWDPIFALTESREPIDPRPAAFAAIYLHYAGLNSGFLTYSEGVNDDVNKIVWDALGWDPKTSVDTILAQYARVFLHREGTQQRQAVEAIRGLEDDWTGPILLNRKIAQTKRLCDSLEANSTPLQAAKNGQWESLVYRATYDDFLQRKLGRERTAEATALAALRGGGDAASRAKGARAALNASQAGPTEQQEHDRLFALAGQLFTDYGIQLSVKLYGASNWERGANLDRADTPLIESAWLEKRIATALDQPDEPARIAELEAIANWQHPVEGALYDDLGDPANESHLVRGTPWSTDPELYHAAIDGIADRTLDANSPGGPWRLSWIDYAETLYEVPLQLHYDGLDPHTTYHVRVTYAGEDYALPLKLVANGSIEIHPARLRKSNPETIEFPVPAAATQSGSLTLAWTGPAGSGGSGRGRQVAEVWLIPQSGSTTTHHVVH